MMMVTTLSNEEVRSPSGIHDPLAGSGSASPVVSASALPARGGPTAPRAVESRSVAEVPLHRRPCTACHHPRSFHLEEDGSAGRCYAGGCKCQAYDQVQAEPAPKEPAEADGLSV